MFDVWLISLWPIADVVPRDKYGHEPTHQNYQYEDGDDYSDFLPPDKRTDSQAMRMSMAWHMTTDDVLDMRWSLFNERLMLHKAVTLRKPIYTPDDYIMERTSRNYKARKRR